MLQVLVLNASYEPLRIIDWKRAVTLLFLERVEVIEEYDREIRSVSLSIKVPSIIRQLKYANIKGLKYRRIKPSKENVFARDKHTCQYCGKKQKPDNPLTRDHVIPKSYGGQITWDNAVACCGTCNNKKGNRTPEEAGMRLIKRPKAPEWVPFIVFTFKMRNVPESWRKHLKFVY